MSDTWLSLWLGLLTFAGVAYPVWVQQKNKRLEARQQERIKLADLEATAERALIEQLQEEVRTMRENRREDATEIRAIHTEFRALQKTLLELEHGVKLLIAQLDMNHITPIWKPLPPEFPGDE